MNLRQCGRTRLLRVTVLCCVSMVELSCVEKGYIRFARPHVYDTETTRQAVKESGTRITGKIREKAEAGATQESFGARELTATKAGVGLQRGMPAPAEGAAPTPPDLPTPGITAQTVLPSAPGTTNFNRTISEQVNDFAHLENQALEVDLLYSGTGDHAFLGPNARVYLVRFDIGLLPTRQNRLLYLPLLIRSGFGTVYDFRNYFAQVSFLIPGLEGDVYIYDLDPRYSVLTATESAASLTSQQLSVLAAMPNMTAQVDYLRQLEEQFAQQRRYPLQLGLISGDREFSWTFGPRRVITKRSFWWMFVPFVNRYKVESHLEPGLRTGHALIVVPDIVKLFPCARRDKSSLLGTGSKGTIADEIRGFAETPPLRDSMYRREMAARATDVAGTLITQLHALERSDLRTLSCPNETALSADIELPMVVKASYIELDRPDVPHPTMMLGPSTGSGAPPSPGTIGASLLPLTLKLPVGPPPLGAVAGTVTIAGRVPLGQRSLITLNVPDANFVSDPPLRALLRANLLNGDPLNVKAIRVENATRVVVLVDGPPKKDPRAATPVIVQIVPEVETQTRRFAATAAAPVSMDWGAPTTTPKAILATAIGSTGNLVTVNFPDPTTFGPGDVASIQFGTVAIPKGVAGQGWWVAGETIQMLCPEPPKGARNVDVMLGLTPAGLRKNSNQNLLRVGAFTYLATAE